MAEANGAALQRWKDASPEERDKIAQIKRARMQVAWEMHIRGDSYGKIGLELGVTPPMARHYVKKMAEENYENNLSDTREMRTLELTRLEKLVPVLWERAEKGDDDAIDRILKISAAKARLAGLYAPVRVKMEHTTKRPVEGEPSNSLDRRIFELYKRLKKRGKAVPGEMQEWAQENVVDGELVSGEAEPHPMKSGEAEGKASVDPSRSENPK